MRDIDLGEDTAYLISDFPVTKDVLDRSRSSRSRFSTTISTARKLSSYGSCG